MNPKSYTPDAPGEHPQFLNLQDAEEVDRFAEELGVTPDELRSIVRRVGPATRTVRQWLLAAATDRRE